VTAFTQQVRGAVAGSVGSQRLKYLNFTEIVKNPGMRAMN
jgi:hypothetical protein